MRQLLLCALLLLSTQAQAQDAFQQLEDLLDRGLYNSAALVAGPALVEANPGNRRAFELYALALLLSGDTEAAREALDTMLRLGDSPEPVTASELQLTGLVLAEEGNPAEAAALLEQAFNLSGSYEHAMAWGRLAWQSGDSDQALAAYRAAAQTEVGSREPWPWLDLGRLLLFREELDEAEAALEQAITVYETYDTGLSLPSPAYVEAFYRLGQVAELRYAATEDPAWLAAASSNYQNALVGDPNYAPARSALERLQANEP